MAEETTAVQNKGMLVVAIVLGLAAVIVYNWQVATIRNESRGEQVKILRFEREMRVGERIDVSKDLSMQEVSKRLATGLGDVVVVNNTAELQMYGNAALNRNVSKGQFLANSMIITSKKPLPSEVLADGDFVGIPIPVRLAMGDILRPGNHVNLLARIPTAGGKLSVERVIDRVRVLAVGGKGLQESVEGGRGEDTGSTTYRQITVELSSDASLELQKIMAYLSGGFDVELLKETGERTVTSPTVKPGLLKMFESGGTPTPRGGAPGPIP